MTDLQVRPEVAIPQQRQPHRHASSPPDRRRPILLAAIAGGVLVAAAVAVTAVGTATHTTPAPSPGDGIERLLTTPLSDVQPAPADTGVTSWDQYTSSFLAGP